MGDLIQHYGYWMVLAGTIFEGDATLVTAAFLAHRGYLSLAVVCLLSGGSTVVANVFLYEAGRRQGARLASERAEKILGWVRARGSLLLLASRFLFALRSAIALACGVAQMPRARFYWVNLAGAVLWVGALAGAGYSGGRLFTLLVDDVKRHEWTAAAVIGLTVCVIALWRSHGRDVRALAHPRTAARESVDLIAEIASHGSRLWRFLARTGRVG